MSQQVDVLMHPRSSATILGGGPDPISGLWMIEVEYTTLAGSRARMRLTESEMSEWRDKTCKAASR